MNFVNEIPKGTRAKMECNPNEPFNPLMQDIKNGKLRDFTYGDIPFNYGFIPQTWESPKETCPHTSQCLPRILPTLQLRERMD